MILRVAPPRNRAAEMMPCSSTPEPPPCTPAHHELSARWRPALVVRWRGGGTAQREVACTGGLLLAVFSSALGQSIRSRWPSLRKLPPLPCTVHAFPHTSAGKIWLHAAAGQQTPCKPACETPRHLPNPLSTAGKTCSAATRTCLCCGHRTRHEANQE